MFITYPESRPQTRAIWCTKRHVDKSAYDIAKSQNSNHNGHDPGCFRLPWFSVTGHLSQNLKNAAMNLSTLVSLGFTTAPMVCLQILYCPGGSNIKRLLIKVIPRESCPVQYHRNGDKHTSPNRMSRPMVRKLQKGANMHLNTHWKLNSAQIIRPLFIKVITTWLVTFCSASTFSWIARLQKKKQEKQNPNLGFCQTVSCRVSEQNSCFLPDSVFAFI